MFFYVVLIGSTVLVHSQSTILKTLGTYTECVLFNYRLLTSTVTNNSLVHSLLIDVIYLFNSFQPKVAQVQKQFVFWKDALFTERLKIYTSY